MATSNTKIVGFCCNYTASVPAETLKEAGLLPRSVQVERVPCTGRLEVPVLLDAFEQGADAVFVAGCRIDECHNRTGSQRAAKRIVHAKQILKELDIDPDRIEMFFVRRGETEPIVEAVRGMSDRISQLGDLWSE